jgi:hypothetical protein
MWRVIGAVVVGLYMIAGFVVFFRRARLGGSVRPLNVSADGEFLLVVIALWPLYVRARAEPPPAAEDACLSCGAPIPAGSGKCAGCGWTWQRGKAGHA